MRTPARSYCASVSGLVLACLAVVVPADASALSDRGTAAVHCSVSVAGHGSWSIRPRHTGCQAAKRLTRRLVRGGDQPAGWRCQTTYVVSQEITCVSKRHREFVATQVLT